MGSLRAHRLEVKPLLSLAELPGYCIFPYPTPPAIKNNTNVACMSLLYFYGTLFYFTDMDYVSTDICKPHNINTKLTKYLNTILTLKCEL